MLYKAVVHLENQWVRIVPEMMLPVEIRELFTTVISDCGIDEFCAAFGWCRGFEEIKVESFDATDGDRVFPIHHLLYFSFEY